MDPKSKEEMDNHANQKNPNNDAYWQSRGEEARPTAANHFDDDDDDKGKDYSEDNDVDWTELDNMSENDWEFNDD